MAKLTLLRVEYDKVKYYICGMIKVSILILETAVIESIADPHYIFKAVNQFLMASGRKALFETQFVGLTKNVTLENGLYTVNCEKLLNEVTSTDLIFIPALSGDLDIALQKNNDYIPWIVNQHQKGAEVASLCIGAFLLAKTGLLNHKKCSTHWNSSQQFRQMFPEVELVDGKVITDENGIYSSGGANSYWSLLLYLVEKYTDREMAILASKFFAVEINRTSQASFMLFDGHKNHSDQSVATIQKYIEENFQLKFTVEELANQATMGRRSFERRFKKATNNSVLEYIQRVKMEVAKRKLESTTLQVNEIMYEIGYADSKAFRSLFKRNTGLTPIEYRNKYNNKMNS